MEEDKELKDDLKMIRLQIIFAISQLQNILATMKQGQEDDKQLIINNLMRELCITDQQARQNYKTTELTIEDVGSLKAFDPNYVQTFLKQFEEEKHYIQMSSTGKISLTDIGRKHCPSFI